MGEYDEHMAHHGSSRLSTTCEVMKWVTVPQSDLAPRERWVPAQHSAKAGTLAEEMCDVYRWAIIDVEEALRNDERKRCVECKQPVRARKAGTNGMSAHFEHVTRNTTCLLSKTARS